MWMSFHIYRAGCKSPDFTFINSMPAVTSTEAVSLVTCLPHHPTHIHIMLQTQNTYCTHFGSSQSPCVSWFFAGSAFHSDHAPWTWRCVVELDWIVPIFVTSTYHSHALLHQPAVSRHSHWPGMGATEAQVGDFSVAMATDIFCLAPVSFKSIETHPIHIGQVSTQLSHVVICPI